MKTGKKTLKSVLYNESTFLHLYGGIKKFQKARHRNPRKCAPKIPTGPVLNPFSPPGSGLFPGNGNRLA